VSDPIVDGLYATHKESLDAIARDIIDSALTRPQQYQVLMLCLAKMTGHAGGVLELINKQRGGPDIPAKLYAFDAATRLAEIFAE